MNLETLERAVPLVKELHELGFSVDLEQMGPANWVAPEKVSNDTWKPAVYTNGKGRASNARKAYFATLRKIQERDGISFKEAKKVYKKEHAK